VPVPAPELFLAPAAAALAMAVGLGALAFKVDLPGYKLGWRQLASFAAAAGLTLGSVPVIVAAGGGRWKVPAQDFASTLATPGQAFRVLWIGDPRALPLGSWQLAPGVGYATSADGPPDATNLWPPRAAGATPHLAGVLRLASARLTTRLGHLLAPMAVRYIVIPSQTAPSGSGGFAVPVPNDILAALDQQTDLRSSRADDAVRVYENSAWAPGRAALAPDVAAGVAQATTPAASQAAELAGATPVLTAGGPDAFAGPLPAAAQVLVSESEQAGWRLSVAGQRATRQQAFGWAMLFTTKGPGGKASLVFVTPLAGRALEVVEVALWLAALSLLVGDRRRWRREKRPPSDQAPEPVPTPDPSPSVFAGVVGHRKPRRVTVPDTGDDDEFWA
jgi:hypothetical protein